MREVGAQVARFEVRQVARAGFTAQMRLQEAKEGGDVALVGFYRIGRKAPLIAQMRDPFNEKSGASSSIE